MTEVTEVSPGLRPELWQGAVAWTPVGNGWQPWRLLPSEEPYAYSTLLYEQAKSPAGVRFAADVTARQVEISIDRNGEDPMGFDVLVDRELVARHMVDGTGGATVDLPDRPCRLEVWLPQAGLVQVRTVVLHGATAVAPVAQRVRWTTYGSSITRCRTAPGPTETWPALVSLRHDWDLTCIGLGGQCHLDYAAERTIAAVETDVISLCLGINIQGAGTFNERTLPGRLSAFLRAVRAAHPDVPILVISPIISPAREETPNGVGLSLSAIRAMVTRVATDLQRDGDDLIMLVNGLDVFGADDVGMLPDGLHPDAAGYRLMGERLAPVLAETLALRR